MLNRRSFLGRIFGIIAGFFVSLWPFKKAEALPEPKPSEPPTEPEKDVRRYTDIKEMFDAIAEHTRSTGDTIIPCDNPMQLLLGYTNAADHQIIWEIKMMNVKKSLEAWEERAKADCTLSLNVELGKCRIVREYLKTSEGRMKLASAFPRSA